MRHIAIVAVSYGIAPILLVLTILLARWLARRDQTHEQEGSS